MQTWMKSEMAHVISRKKITADAALKNKIEISI